MVKQIAESPEGTGWNAAAWQADGNGLVAEWRDGYVTVRHINKDGQLGSAVGTIGTTARISALKFGNDPSTVMALDDDGRLILFDGRTWSEVANGVILAVPLPAPK